MDSDTCAGSFHLAFRSRLTIARHRDIMTPGVAPWRTQPMRLAFISDMHRRAQTIITSEKSIIRLMLIGIFPHIEMTEIRTPFLAVEAALRGRP
ncbi:hypothetical protein ACVDG8_028975 [Mesorhizobium sp. ORM8.1]